MITDNKSKEVFSRRGEKVDFKLLQLKNQLNNAPKTIDVERRERFIDKRRRRSGARKINEMLAEQAENQKYAREKIEEQRKTYDNEDQESVDNSQAETIVEVIKNENDGAENVVNQEEKIVEKFETPKRLDRKVR